MQFNRYTLQNRDSKGVIDNVDSVTSSISGTEINNLSNEKRVHIANFAKNLRETDFSHNAPINREVQEIYDTGIRDSIVLDDLIPASSDWNFYEEYTSDKMEELIESILEVGLLQPIVVWKQLNGKYMILAGHNRYKAYKILNDSGMYGKRYSRILATIKEYNELDSNMAQQIIIDTNWVSRELTATQRAKSIVRKYAILEQKGKETNTRFKINEILGESYGLGRTQIVAYKSLINLIPELQEKVDECVLGVRPGGKISKLSTDVQKYIYDEYLKDNSSAEMINKLSSKFSDSLTIPDIDVLVDDYNKKLESKQALGVYEIHYAEGRKKATITFPKEDELHFNYLFKLFCGEVTTDEVDGTPKLVAIDSDVYTNGDFIYKKIK